MLISEVKEWTSPIKYLKTYELFYDADNIAANISDTVMTSSPLTEDTSPTAIAVVVSYHLSDSYKVEFWCQY